MLIPVAAWREPVSCDRRWATLRFVSRHLETVKCQLTFTTFASFSRFVPAPPAGSDVGGVSNSGSMGDLRFFTGAVISFETFSFCVRAPPVPRPGRVNVRASAGEVSDATGVGGGG